MSSVGEERRWLQDILLSDSSDSSASGSDTDNPITEEDFQEMLKFHILRKKYQARFYQKPEVKSKFKLRSIKYMELKIHNTKLLFSEYSISIL